MRTVNPFLADDLAELDERLLSRAEIVVAMEEVHSGQEARDEVIGLRHDVDHDLTAAIEFAKWEAERGYRSTYFVLHTASYWADKARLRYGLDVIAAHGHEIGFHTNAITVALETGRHPHAVLAEAVDELRSYGHPVRGVVAHGDPLCHRAHYVNDEQFVECARPDYGAPDRVLRANGRELRLQPILLADFGFDYESNRLPRAFYLSDSGGRWSTPFDEAVAGYPYDGQTHLLVHPCWWGRAFAD